MTDIAEVETALQQKYAKCEELFKSGDMERVVAIFYAENICYLTGDLRVVRGRRELVKLFTSIQSQISEVQVEPVLTYGDPDGTGVVYQFCNTSRRMSEGGEVMKAHYIAAFRAVENDWLCEMEVPALGAIVVPDS